MGVSGGTVQAVKTRYLGPTRTLGPRVKATSSGRLDASWTRKTPLPVPWRALKRTAHR